jgi:prophage antirepressor-like protein
MNTPGLCFNDVTFDVVDRNGSAWLKTSEVATALGYADQSGVTRIYSRNADEFTNEMTCSVKLTEHGQIDRTRSSERSADILTTRRTFNCHVRPYCNR